MPPAPIPTFQNLLITGPQILAVPVWLDFIRGTLRLSQEQKVASFEWLSFLWLGSLLPNTKRRKAGVGDHGQERTSEWALVKQMHLLTQC